MREIEHGAFRIQTAEDMLSLHQSAFDENWGEIHKGHLVRMFTKRVMVRELLEVWQNRTGLNGAVILEAHGGFQDEQWVYYENDQPARTIQEWVDEMDGTTAALMITSCNPMGSEVASQQSLVMHAGRLAGSFPAMVHTPGLIRLYVPNQGYLEGNYKRIRRIIGT